MFDIKNIHTAREQIIFKYIHGASFNKLLKTIVKFEPQVANTTQYLSVIHKNHSNARAKMARRDLIIGCIILFVTLTLSILPFFTEERVSIGGLIVAGPLASIQFLKSSFIVKRNWKFFDDLETTYPANA